MLVLTRKKNEGIVISDDIEIVVVEIRADKVRLGVRAPRAISVHRREVYDAISDGAQAADDRANAVREQLIHREFEIARKREEQDARRHEGRSDGAATIDRTPRGGSERCCMRRRRSGD